MTKLVLAVLLLSLLSATAFSQQAPWADLPKSSFVESVDGPKDVFLTLDTIRHYPGSSPDPERDPRLTGNIDIMESYYPTGNMKSITGSNGYSLHFAEDGKPLKHEPLTICGALSNRRKSTIDHR